MKIGLPQNPVLWCFVGRLFLEWSYQPALAADVGEGGGGGGD